MGSLSAWGLLAFIIGLLLVIAVVTGSLLFWLQRRARSIQPQVQGQVQAQGISLSWLKLIFNQRLIVGILVFLGAQLILSFLLPSVWGQIWSNPKLPGLGWGFELVLGGLLVVVFLERAIPHKDSVVQILGAALVLILVFSVWGGLAKPKLDDRKTKKDAIRAAQSAEKPIQVSTKAITVSREWQEVFTPRSHDALVYINQGPEAKEILSDLLVQTGNGDDSDGERDGPKVKLEVCQFDKIWVAPVTVNHNNGEPHRVCLDGKRLKADIQVILVRGGADVVNKSGWEQLVSDLVSRGVIEMPQESV